MIGVSATKCQLNADDLAEYESAKANWKRAPPKSFPKKAGAVSEQKNMNNQHQNDVRSRIGLTSSK